MLTPNGEIYSVLRERTTCPEQLLTLKWTDQSFVAAEIALLSSWNRNQLWASGDRLPQRCPRLQQAALAFLPCNLASFLPWHPAPWTFPLLFSKEKETFVINNPCVLWHQLTYLLSQWYLCLQVSLWEKECKNYQEELREFSVTILKTSSNPWYAITWSLVRATTKHPHSFKQQWEK